MIILVERLAEASKGMSRTIFIWLWRSWVKLSIQVDHLLALAHADYLNPLLILPAGSPFVIT